MLRWISIFGGPLIMMGSHARSEVLFYYFRLEDHIPDNHLLRLIDKHVSFEFVRQQLKDSYSETGRPSVDPELLLRIVLIGYLYGITSARKLVEELRMHLAWRWFTGLGFDQEIPHHSTFSKNRHGRFQESKLFEQLFFMGWRPSLPYLCWLNHSRCSRFREQRKILNRVPPRNRSPVVPAQLLEFVETGSALPDVCEQGRQLRIGGVYRELREGIAAWTADALRIWKILMD